MKEKNPEIDAFLKRAKTWREEMKNLRRIALDCGLGEALKWGKPCYTFGDGNVGIIQPFKERCAFMFFKGALLEDPDGLLGRPGAHSHVGRRMMFESVRDVVEMEASLRAFIAEAIEIEKAGRRVEVKERPEPLPEELEAMFKEVPGLKKAFNALTPGRQRAYVLHFSSAKQSKTRRSRIEKCVPSILEGKGMRD